MLIVSGEASMFYPKIPRSIRKEQTGIFIFFCINEIYIAKLFFYRIVVSYLTNSFMFHASLCFQHFFVFCFCLTLFFSSALCAAVLSPLHNLFFFLICVKLWLPGSRGSPVNIKTAERSKQRSYDVGASEFALFQEK